MRYCAPSEVQYEISDSTSSVDRRPQLPIDNEVVEEIEPTVASRAGVGAHWPSGQPGNHLAQCGTGSPPPRSAPAASPPFLPLATTAASSFFSTNQPARHAPALRRRNVSFPDPFRFRLDRARPHFYSSTFSSRFPHTFQVKRLQIGLTNSDQRSQPDCAIPGWPDPRAC